MQKRFFKVTVKECLEVDGLLFESMATPLSFFVFDNKGNGTMMLSGLREVVDINITISDPIKIKND